MTLWKKVKQVLLLHREAAQPHAPSWPSLCGTLTMCGWRWHDPRQVHRRSYRWVSPTNNEPGIAHASSMRSR